MSPKLSSDTTVVFHDPAYPGACSLETLTRLIPGEAQVIHAPDLSTRLQEGCNLLISFHGPYFPKDAWNALLGFLEAGGNLAVFGGMPFTRPVRADGTVEPEQRAYTDQLYLGAFFPVELPAADISLVAADEAAFLEQCTLDIAARQPGKFWSSYPMLTQAVDHPDDLGSAGPLDTLLTPLLFACADTPNGEQRLATPALLLDQRQGRFRGGRWLLSLWQPPSSESWLTIAPAIHQFLLLAAEGSSMLDVHPQLACYQPGEVPTLVISSRSQQNTDVQATVYTAQGDVLKAFEMQIEGSSVLQETRIQLQGQTEPGLHRVEVAVQRAHAVALRQRTGFWIWDEQLIATTARKRLQSGRDYFYQDGRLFPVFGTTYMDSSVQRRFLHLPNPARWETDFAEMKRAGVNTIRTGIWTAWRDYMAMAGFANEGVLRALDAFVMTACKHNIQVMFTFFSFYPPLFEGENPWLDPRAIEGQQDFVTAFVRRYSTIELISWDLINEPSFGDPRKIFSQRPIPNYDRFELAAFQQWLMERYTIDELQQRWRQTPADFNSYAQITLPVAQDYSTSLFDTTTRQMLKVMDYTHFSQEMFKKWAETMYAAIRATGSVTLIGVGQDEAGSRLAPQFYAPVVDYTTTHPWWNNDHLLWDMLLDKTLEKPNLIQEIGVIPTRDNDMQSWLSEQASANLLERKLITGVLARGAGLIQWLWHSNTYMKDVQENGIGLVRADGSAKPEMAVMLEVGRLMQLVADQCTESADPPDTWVVIPYSQWFLRPDLAIEATRQCARVLGYDFGIIPQMVAEHQLASLAQHTYRPRTIILPAVQTLMHEAWQTLMTFVEQGATLLVSGVLTRDQHNLATPFDLTGETREELNIVPVSHYEYLTGVAGETHQIVFGNDKIKYVKKAHNRLNTYNRGAGKIIWSGLPLELSSSVRTIHHVYQQALHMNREIQEDNPVLVIRKAAKDGTLILIVSECSCPHQITLDKDITIEIAPNRAGAVFVRNDGEVTYFGGTRYCTSQ